MSGLLGLLATGAGVVIPPPDPVEYATLHGTDRAGIMDAAFTTSVRTSATQRVEHHAMRAMTDVRIAHTNLDGTGAGPNDFTIALAIELENGTLYPATYGGLARTVVSPREHVITDPIDVSLAAGERFWVRTYTQVATLGQAWPGCNNYNSSAARGEGTNHYSGTYLGADWTVSGSPAWPNDLNINGLSVFQPTAIIGTTPDDGEPVWAIIGDSIYAAGVDVTFTSTAFGWPARLATAAGHAWMKVSQSGRTMTNLLNAQRQTDWYTDAIPNCTHALVGMGRNDLSLGATFASLSADAQAVWADLRARGIQHVTAATITPQTTSTDAWATTGNQTIASSAVEAARVAYNNWLRTLPAGIDAVIEVADVVETARNSGIWKASYTADGLHPTGATHAVIAATIGTLPA